MSKVTGSDGLPEPGSGSDQWVPPQFPRDLQSMARSARRRPRLSAVLRGSVRVLTYALAAAAFGFLGGWFGQSVANDDSANPTAPGDEITSTLLPPDGITLDVRWGNIPQRLTQEGVIDIDKFAAAAQASGSALSAEQLTVLREGSDEPIHVDASSAYFLVDVLWALGLANKNTVLREGPMAQQGWDQAGDYASTGGWTIGAKAGPEYLATLDLVPLTPEQQAVVEEVTYNSYRPCCGNMTAFPDCNHGMAALALTELMASQGATADEIFGALKQISPFWFPTQYHHLAMYFEQNGRGEWKDVDARLVMGQQYSSSGGWKQVNAWLEQSGALGSSGPGGGTASGCAP